MRKKMTQSAYDEYEAHREAEDRIDQSDFCGPCRQVVFDIPDRNVPSTLWLMRRQQTYWVRGPVASGGVCGSPKTLTGSFR